MARIHFFEKEKIAVYIYGELNGKHHGKHVMLLVQGHEYQYGFNGKPMKGCPALRDDKTVVQWILSHTADLEERWQEANEGKHPRWID